MSALLEDLRVNLAAHPVGYPLARLSRRLGPVVRIPGLGLLVSDAALAHEILVREDDFRKNGPGSVAARVTATLGPAALINMDGDAHLALRRRLNDVVSPDRARTMLRALDQPIARLRERIVAGERVDLVRFMRYASGRITYDMLGVPVPGPDEEASCVELVALGERLTAGFDIRRTSARRLARMKEDVDVLVAHARAGFDAGEAPERSFVRRLRDAGLSFEEARGVLGIIFLAGTLTTAAVLPRLVALLMDAKHWPALSADRERVPQAIAEGLRYTTPLPATVRIASRDIELNGHTIRAHTRVVVLLVNLARDPKLFDDPDRFDPSRPLLPRSRHLWFGAGPHFCLGFSVAQLELQMVLEALLDAGPALEIVGRARSRGVVVPAYARLDVQVGRGRG